jgi:hypothetical protein
MAEVDTSIYSPLMKDVNPFMRLSFDMGYDPLPGRHLAAEVDVPVGVLNFNDLLGLSRLHQGLKLGQLDVRQFDAQIPVLLQLRNVLSLLDRSIGIARRVSHACKPGLAT